MPRMVENLDSDIILSVERIKKYYPVRSGLFSALTGFVRAVDDVTFSLEKGKTLGIVGESGSGKSTLARSIAMLVHPNEGAIVLLGRKLEDLKKEELRKFRINFQMVFQDPISSLNPRKLAIDIVGEPLRIHYGLHGDKLTEEVTGILEKVGLDRTQLYRYPHEFSGGQKQRLGLARALAVKPKLLILDEPTSNLDVSVQSQVLKLILSIQKDLRLSYIFISHDMAVIYHACDTIIVMYAGRIVEKAESRTLFSSPLHPYTRGLQDIAESHGMDIEVTLGGEPPNLRNLPPGCRFEPRCPYRVDLCARVEPQLVEVGPGHFVSCHVFAPSGAVDGGETTAEKGQ